MYTWYIAGTYYHDIYPRFIPGIYVLYYILYQEDIFQTKSWLYQFKYVHAYDQYLQYTERFCPAMGAHFSEAIWC